MWLWEGQVTWFLSTSPARLSRLSTLSCPVNLSLHVNSSSFYSMAQSVRPSPFLCPIHLISVHNTIFPSPWMSIRTIYKRGKSAPLGLSYTFWGSLKKGVEKVFFGAHEVRSYKVGSLNFESILFSTHVFLWFF